MNNRNVVKRQSNYCSFFFVEPKDKADAHAVAKKLMGIQGIDEVHITEGDFGFVVKTKSSSSDKNAAVLEQHTLKRLAKRVSLVRSYYQYSK